MKVCRKDYIAGLREFAEYLEQHPELPMPDQKTLSAWVFSKSHVPDSVRSYDIAETAKNMGFCEKVFNQETVGLLRRFKGLTYQIKWGRGAVCKRVLVGYRTTQTEWGYQKLTSPIVGKEPIYKWECPESLIKACEE